MAYDRDLADRIRTVIAEHHPDEAPAVTERAMFGGLGFLVSGSMAVAASSNGAMMVRCNPADAERHVAAGARAMVMRGTTMSGWLEVPAAMTDTDIGLTTWVSVGMARVADLPAK